MELKFWKSAKYKTQLFYSSANYHLKLACAAAKYLNSYMYCIQQTYIVRLNAIGIFALGKCPANGETPHDYYQIYETLWRRGAIMVSGEYSSQSDINYAWKFHIYTAITDKWDVLLHSLIKFSCCKMFGDFLVNH